MLVTFLLKLTKLSSHFNFQFQQELKINLDHPKMSGETTVQDAITEVAAMMGENVRLRRGFVMSTPNGIVSTYLHRCPQPGTMVLKFSLSNLRAQFHLHGSMCILNAILIKTKVYFKCNGMWLHFISGGI